MNDLELKDRSKLFSHRCVKLALSLPKGILGAHVAKQLIRSSTSVAANYRASCLAQSRNSFAAKISIVLEESDESYFWIEFIIDENLIPMNKALPLLKEADELTRIFAASRKTSQQKQSSILNLQ
jgi:four helix bundle protein